MGAGFVVCLEGPSAVGKTTVARRLEERGPRAIPEVNILFQRPAGASLSWYIDRQIDRAAQARAAADRDGLAILDGDPFQPVWYNWIYPEFGPLAEVLALYRTAIAEGRIAFPNCYVMLSSPGDVLTTRKHADLSRQRRNFDRHMKMIDPQRRYFLALRDTAHVDVRFIENTAIDDTVHALAGITPLAAGAPHGADILAVMSEWLARHVRPC